MRQAMYVLTCLYHGMAKEKIAETLDGDDESVNVWIRFLSDMGWVTRSSKGGRWYVSDSRHTEFLIQGLIQTQS